MVYRSLIDGPVMHRRVTWFGICRWILGLWVGVTALAVSASLLSLDGRSADALNNLSIDVTRETQVTPIVALTDVDLLKRYQTADLYALTEPIFQGPPLSSSAQPTIRVTVTASDHAGSEGRNAAADKPAHAEENPNKVADPTRPDSKLGSLVMAIVLILVLLAFGLIGYKLRRHSHSHRPVHHSSSHRSSHRFIAYDTDRQ